MVRSGEGSFGRARARLAFALAVVGLVALQLTLGAPQGSAGICSFNPSTHALTVSGAGAVHVDRDGPSLLINGAPCQTVTTVDTVLIDIGGVGSDGITFDLSHGKLAPGFTNEGNGSSEIEFDVTNLGPTGGVDLVGGSGGDLFTAGSRTLSGSGEHAVGINLNGGDELFDADEDVTVHAAAPRIEMTGGSGGDVLSGAGTGLSGSSPVAGPMKLVDGPGNDNVKGGSGNDMFVPGLAPGESDTYQGGGGKDTLSYRGRTLAMDITEDGNFNDGVHCPDASCEGDNVAADVEKVVGGTGADTIAGSGAPNVLNGGGGKDTLKGAGGNDVLNGGPGNDTLNGGPGTDTCKQGAGTGPKTGCELEFHRSGEHSSATLRSS